LQFISNGLFTTSFSPFCSHSFLFKNFRLFELLLSYIFTFTDKLLSFVGSLCDLCASNLFKCPICVERYDHLEQLCTLAELAL
jgi:hypothetical protein